MNRVCRTCGAIKPLSEFPRNRRHSSGRGLDCNVCNRARAAAWQKKNRERYLARQRAWTEANREYKREQDRAYRETSKDEIVRRRKAREVVDPLARERRLKRERIAKRKYALRNRAKVAAKNGAWYERRDPGLRNVAQRTWRANNHEKVVAERASRSMMISKLDSAYMVVLDDDPCAYCGGTAGEIDHIVPIRDGGGNEWTNLTAACRRCNTTKNARSLLRHLALRNCE